MGYRVIHNGAIHVLETLLLIRKPEVATNDVLLEVRKVIVVVTLLVRVNWFTGTRISCWVVCLGLPVNSLISKGAPIGFGDKVPIWTFLWVNRIFSLCDTVRILFPDVAQETREAVVFTAVMNEVAPTTEFPFRCRTHGTVLP